MPFSFSSSPFNEVLSAFRGGEMVIMTDDEHRENEGDLVIATEKLTSQALAFMMQQARGLICVSLSVELAEKLNLPLQTLNNSSAFQTPFAVSIDHKKFAGMGVGAEARAFTMRSMLSDEARADDFVSPGPVFPLIAHPSGVIGRPGQTEGSYDLARIAGFKASGVLCEILNEDGTMARGPALKEFAQRHGLKLTSVAEILRYRIEKEVLIREAAQAKLETDYGVFRTHVFIDDVDGKEHLALLYGEENFLRSMDGQATPLLRIHSECLTGDVFGSRRCDCGEQLAESMRRIIAQGSGIIMYLRQEGRGIGLSNKLKAYALQDLGHDTVEANKCLGFSADLRDFAVAAKILAAFGVESVELLTNNPKKMQTLESFGIKVTRRVPIIVEADQYNKSYLQVKKDKLGHWL